MRAQPLSPEGLRGFGAICNVGLPRRWLGHRLCQAALHLAPTRRNQTHHTFTTACQDSPGALVPCEGALCASIAALLRG